MRNVPHSEELVGRIDRPTFVLDDGDSDRHVEYFASGKELREMNIVIRGYVTGDRTQPPTTQMGRMVADLLKLAKKPMSLGANARYANPDSIEKRVLSDRVAIVAMPMQIVYWYAGSAP
jgi:hypothetical protein